MSKSANEDHNTDFEKFRDIFVSATGSEEIVETQEQEANSERVIADESVSETVTDIAKEDGLTDTYTDPVYSNGDG
jgi:hypothetical protein